MKETIYLAGGLKGDWQDRIISCLNNTKFTFYDPRQHGRSEPKEYTTWDLHHLSKSNILLGYMTETNPSGYGLALEIGYAKAMNKTIILVDDRSKIDPKFGSYFGMCHSCADVRFDTLQEAIDYLSIFN